MKRKHRTSYMRNKNLINRPLTDKVNDVQANPTSHKPNISVHGRLSEEEQETMREGISEFLEYKEHGDIDLSELNKGNQEAPAYATPQSAGMDLRANIEKPITINPMERVLIGTGLYIALPIGYEAQVRPRRLAANVSAKSSAKAGPLAVTMWCDCTTPSGKMAAPVK